MLRQEFFSSRDEFEEWLFFNRMQLKTLLMSLVT